MGSTIDRWMITNELADAVLRLTGSWQVVEYNRQLVLIEGFIDIGNVAMYHVEQPIHFHNDNTIALGVALSFDEIDAFSNLLARREVVIGTICEADGHKIRASQK